MIKLVDAARNKWRSILPAHGISAEFLTGKHGPCPVCGGKDRFRFDDQEGRGTFFCSGSCGAGTGVDLLMKKRGWTFRECDAAVRPMVGGMPETSRRAERKPGDTLAACRRLWNGAHDLRDDDDASRYLHARGLDGPYPRELRFTPECVLTGYPELRHLPALLALVRGPDGNGVSVHRTYLDGARKADIESPRRVMPGILPRGSAIRLVDHAGVLGIAEGIETALGVQHRFGMPCWSVINATMLAEFEWPGNVRELHVFGDNDTKFGGQAAAFRLAHRAATAPKPPSVEVHIPSVAGNDWLDEDVRHAA